MAAQNPNIPWRYSASGRSPVYPPRHNERCANPTRNSDGFVDATVGPKDESLPSSVQSWPGSYQDNTNDGNFVGTGATAVYPPRSHDEHLFEGFDANSSNPCISQHDEYCSETYMGSHPSPAPFRNVYHQQMALVRYPSHSLYTSPHEENNPSWEDSERARLTQMGQGGQEQQFGPETECENTQLYQGEEGPEGSLTNMASNGWFYPPPVARQTSRQSFQAVDQYPRYSEAQPNADLNQLYHNVMTPFVEGYFVASAQNNLLGYSSEPWSPENARRFEPQESLNQMAGPFVRQTDTSETHSGITGFDNTESNATDDRDTSASSVISEDKMMRSLETLRCNEHIAEDQVPHIDDHHLFNAQESLVDSVNRFRLQVRASTPFENNGGQTLLSAGHPGLLPVPPSHGSTSEASSPTSTASPSMPDVIFCNECHAEFSGDYRKGNLARHIRLKHRDRNGARYLCEADNCNRSFKRQDARLKHYRRHHSYLAQQPIPRGPRGSRRPSQSRTPTSGQEPQEQVLMDLIS